MKNSNDHKDHQSLESFDRNGKVSDFAKDKVYVTRYITEWNLDTRKTVTTISGDLHIGQKPRFYIE